MKNYLLLSSFAIIVCSCMTNGTLTTMNQAQKNVDRMWEIEIGMTQEEVYQVMRYPLRDDHIETENGCYDIWFYITKGTVLDQGGLQERNLTPLIFKDGIYVGRGYAYYHWVLKKCAAAQKKASIKPPAPEEDGLEKTLNKPAPPKEQSSGNPVSMSKTEPKTEKPPKQPPKKQQEETPDKKTPQEKKPPLDKDDERILDQEQDENFNFW